MGYHQRRRVDPFSSEEDDVDIQLSWSPSDPGPTAGVALRIAADGQKRVRIQPGAPAEDYVQEVGLFCDPPRRGLDDPRHGVDRHPFAKEGNTPLDRAQPVPEI